MIRIEDTKQDIMDRAVRFFDQGYACAQSVLLSFSGYFKLDERTAKLIASTFGGGMGRLRETCGAVTGGFMVLGLAYGNEQPDNMDSKLHSYRKVRELNKRFVEKNATSNCKELLIKHATEQQVGERKHHKIICRKLVGEATGIVYDILKEDQIYNEPIS